MTNSYRAELAKEFNEKNDCGLYEQTIKLSEETGEVSEAVLGFTGDLLFKEGASADEVGDELADLIATGHYVAVLAGVDDMHERALTRMQENIERDDQEANERFQGAIDVLEREIAEREHPQNDALRLARRVLKTGQEGDDGE